MRAFNVVLLGLILLAPISQASAAPVTFSYDCVSMVAGACNNGVANGTSANPNSGTVVGGVNPAQAQATNGNRTSAQITQDVYDIRNYMNAVFAAAGVANSVTLNKGTKALRGQTPDETVSGGVPHPVAGKPYLSNTDGETNRNAPLTGVGSHPSAHPSKDTYLINDWNATNLLAADKKDRIVITFANPIPWVAFDWEIFPQTGLTHADITVLADGHQIFFQDLASQASWPCSPNPSCHNTQVQLGNLGTFAHFDFDTSNAAWVAAGGGNGGVHVLQFIDWTTAPVGIDNLQVGQVVPEPASLLLLGSGLAGLGLWGRRKNRKD